MNKKTLRIAGWALGLSMAVAGIGVAVGANAKAPMETKAAVSSPYSLTPNQASTGSSATAYITSLTTFTYAEIGWAMNQWNPKTLQVKTNQNSAASEFRFYNTTAFPGKITNVTITFSALTVSDETKLMFLGGSSQVTTTTGGTAGVWDSSAKTLSWTPGKSDNYNYFAFYQDGKAASGSNFLATENAIVVTYSVPVTGIALNHSSESLIIGNNLQLNATITPNTATNKGVTWESSNSSIASVDANGLVTAVAAGSATITAKSAENSEISATCDITVTASKVDVTSISLDNTSADIVKGNTLNLTPTVLPNNATNKNVTWESSDETVATVENGVVTALKVGETKITAISVDNPEITASCDITVTPIAVSSVSLDKTALSLVEGLDETLVATISPANADNKNVTWESSDDSIATVENGVVTAVSAGNATITVTTEDGTKTATCNVTVVAKAVASIVITANPKTSYNIGEAFDLTGLKFTANYNDFTSVENLTPSSIGFSVNREEGSIFTKNDLGEQTITIGYGGRNTTFIVTVSNAVKADQYVDDSASDTLNRELTDVSGNSYSNWSGKSDNSSAVYAGNSAGDNDSIQLRSNNSNSGVITTTSGGKVKKITVEWNSNTANGRTLNVYGKNSAYSAATDLYNNSNQGTLLGTIVYGTSTELSIDGDYAYVGLRSNSGAMYLTSVQIDWAGEIEKQSNVVVSSSVIDEVNTFIANYMKFGTISKSDGTKGTTCVDSDFAEEGHVLGEYEALSENAKLVITTSEDTYDYVNSNLVTYEDVLNRLISWADINGYNYAEGVFTKKGNFGGGLGSLSFSNLGNDSNAPLAVAVIGGVGILAVGGLLVSHKRREE